MVRYFCKIFCFVSLFLFTIGIRAQVDLVIKPASKDIIVKGNIIYNLEKVDVNLNIESILTNYKDGEVRCAYTLIAPNLNKEKGNVLLIKKSNEGKKFVFKGVEYLRNLNQSGTYVVDCEVVWNDSLGKEQHEVKKIDFQVGICKTPNLTCKKEHFVVFSGNEKELMVNGEGGYSKGWIYQWENLPQGSNNKYLFKAENKGTDKKSKDVVVKAINYAPDGKTIWGRFERTITFDIWAAPSQNVINNATDIFTDESYEAKVNTIGGDPSAWKYEWSENGSVLGFSKICSKVYSYSSPKNIIWTLKVTNAPKGIEKEDIYTATEKIAVYYWPTIIVNNLVEKPIVTYSGTDIKLGVNVNGGNENGWSYKWSASNENKSSIRYYAVCNAEDFEKHVVSLEVKNISPSGKVLVNRNFKYNLTVWKAPSVDVVGKTENEAIYGDILDFGVITNGGDQTAWTYKWYINDNPLSVDKNKLSFNTSTIEDQWNGRTFEHSVVVTNNPLGIDKPFTKTFHFKTIVYEKPKYIGQNCSEPVTCSGRSNSLEVSVGGGFPTGWTCEWKKNGSILKGNKLNYFYIEESKVRTNDVYVATIRNYNKEKGILLFEKECKFEVEVWPKPEVKYFSESDRMGYVGNECSVDIDVIGGYENNWKYEWFINEENVTSPNNEKAFIIPKANRNGGYLGVSCLVSNQYKNTKWFSKVFSFVLSSWTKGNVKKIEMDSVDTEIGKTSVRNNSQIALQTNVDGGYDKGWSYKWLKNGTLLKSETTHNLSLNYKDPTTTYKDDEFILEYENKIGDEIGINGSIIYNLRIWAEARMPDLIKGPESVREGDIFNLSVEPVIGGYSLHPDKNWKYKWEGFEGNTNEQVCNEQNLFSSKGKDKSTIKKTYNLSIINYGPTKNIWDCRNLSHDVIFYKKPKTPSLLREKGNGTSCTLITVVEGLTDEDLELCEYYFVYGYTTAEGKDVVFSSNDHLRYRKFSSDEFSKINWVYTKWVYENGSVVTSGKRYKNGSCDENFDGSSFIKNTNRSPSDQTGIDVTYNNSIHIDANKFVAKVLNPEEACLSIYTINGRLVNRKIYEASCTFNEKLYYENLSAGVYMIEVKIGQMRKVKKIFVHK